MNTFLEILKITLPALVIGVTVYFVVREMMRRQIQMQHQHLQSQRQSGTMPLRMQAYERLSLFVERLSLPGLLMRTHNDEMSATTLRLTMLLNVQQEFEHNISQQVYVSDQLWRVIEATRDDLIEFITVVSEKVPKDAPSRQLRDALIGYQQQREQDPISIAQMAIRKEAASLF
ncbi:MAG: hypothetical protein AAFZ63_15435 [Bacteroidota bacterium]